MFLVSLSRLCWMDLLISENAFFLVFLGVLFLRLPPSLRWLLIRTLSPYSHPHFFHRSNVRVAHYISHFFLSLVNLEAVCHAQFFSLKLLQEMNVKSCCVLNCPYPAQISVSILFSASVIK